MKRIICALLSLATLILLPFAFASCSKAGDFVYILNDDGESYGVEFNWAERYRDSIEEFKIPDNYKGKPVTRLYGLSDYAEHYIDKLIIPASIEYIGQRYTAHTDSILTNIRVGEIFFEEGSRCQVIANYAFYAPCSRYNDFSKSRHFKINLPETIKEIGDYAFYGCIEAEGISVPSGITRIGECAFKYCQSLQSVTIPQGFTKIGDRAFDSCISLTSVVIPDSVTEIGINAFYDCALSSVTLPQNLETIHDGAFTGNNFSTISIPSSVTNIGNSAFSRTSLKSITIPATVQSLGKGVFSDSSLETITFEDGIDYPSVKENTFSGCGNLKTVHLPNDLESIGDSAFENCDDLTNIQLPNSLKNIGARAFLECKSLRNITFPDLLERVEEQAFEYCTSLSSVTFGQNEEGIYFGNKAFYRCTKLQKVYIGNVTTWLQSTFDGSYWNPLEMDADKVLLNDSMTDLVIPAKVEKIFNRAFANCNELERVIFESGSKCSYIGSSAFVGCTSLKAVVFDNTSTLTSIFNNAFADCTSLSDFSMPTSVKTVGTDAFKNCTSLTDVSIENMDSWLSIEFKNEEANPVKYAKSLSFNGSPISKLEIPQELTRIPSYAFINCSTLTEITLPKAMQSVGKDAFSGCTGLAKIHLESLAAWCTMQFDDILATPLGCNANLYINELLLTDIVIPETIQTLRESVFAGCSALETVDLEKVTSVGANAFAGCSSLTKVYIPTAVTKIGENAFADCVNLTIYAQALLAPNGKAHEGWHDNWNPLNRPVKWGYVLV